MVFFGLDVFFKKRRSECLELNISKTVILPKAITQQAIFDVAHGFINATPQLT